jgi:hypothetical protein
MENSDNYFSAPTLIVIAINIFVIISLLRKVYAKKGRKNKKPTKLRQIFSFTSLTINLGITWILFLLYVHKLSHHFSIFSYAFIILNGLQVSYFLTSIK